MSRMAAVLNKRKQGFNDSHQAPLFNTDFNIARCALPPNSSESKLIHSFKNPSSSAYFVSVMNKGVCEHTSGKNSRYPRGILLYFLLYCFMIVHFSSGKDDIQKHFLLFQQMHTIIKS
jgi:hypothetical protein